MNVLEFQDIHRAYVRGQDVLSGIDLILDEGETVALLGRNGAGKTTLLRIAMGMLEAQRGTVRVFGLDPRKDAVEVKRRIGYMAEDQVLPGFMRVQQVIDLHRSLFATWDDILAAELEQRFGLDSRARIRQLSKGQARQVALLCAVAHRPELLILDEPAGGLDPAARREFLEVSIRMLSDGGTTILFSSHHLSDVERMADRVVMLRDHGVLLDSSLEQLREDCSLALLPANRGTYEHLRQLPGCLTVRQRGDTLQALFQRQPQALQQELRTEFGVTDFSCAPSTLEDMFVELLGDRS